MNVSDLIESLESFKKEYGDLPVRLFTDHSQVHMQADGVNLQYTEDLNSYMSEPISEEDADENDDEVCEIFAG